MQGDALDTVNELVTRDTSTTVPDEGCRSGHRSVTGQRARFGHRWSRAVILAARLCPEASTKSAMKPDINTTPTPIIHHPKLPLWLNAMVPLTMSVVARTATMMHTTAWRRLMASTLHGVRACHEIVGSTRRSRMVLRYYLIDF